MLESVGKSDPMQHLDYMEAIESDIMDKVLERAKEYDYEKYNASNVRRALGKDFLTIEDYAAILSPAAEDFFEELAKQAQAETRRYFGNSVSLYTPLYISNYCENHCTYCGFNCTNKILRGKLSIEEIEKELKAIAATGLKEILLLTGESRKQSNIEYIGEAVKLSKNYFSTTGLEVYPLNTDEYAYLHKCGADFVSVYQESYDADVYEKYHLAGPKRVYPYRFNAQERAVKGGMRGVVFGALLGLGDFRRDAFSAGLHAYYLQQKYPHAEIGFSVPRIRGHKNNPDGSVELRGVREKQLLQVLLAYRLFMPFTSITISTRERAGFRDNVIGLAANKISAGVKVGVGGHDADKKGDEQFEVADPRDVSQVHTMIIDRGLQPVYTDYIRLM
ncbi:MAG: 2-iminoacetate synthase ThiH [Spirochaetaceae bacterium]|nr:2-iminoacetate synthase ThiH [Spirochaetaceae bacterium]